MTFGPRYRALVYLTLFVIFLVVVWGGVVRVTGSGLGCPDWPTYHGQFLPSLGTATRIECECCDRAPETPCAVIGERLSEHDHPVRELGLSPRAKRATQPAVSLSPVVGEEVRVVRTLSG